MSSPKKRSSASVLLLLLLLVVAVPGILWGVGTYEPVKLATFQEQVLGLVKGGVTPSQEQLEIEGCVLMPGSAEAGNPDYRAIRRTTRTVRFADGSTLTVIYGHPPEPNPQCP